jgi:hypothetical protein
VDPTEVKFDMEEECADFTRCTPRSDTYFVIVCSESFSRRTGELYGGIVTWLLLDLKANIKTVQPFHSYRKVKVIIITHLGVWC